MSNIDKQAVQAVADLKAGYTLGHADVAILNELASIALASLEAEPVAWIVHARTGDQLTADGGYVANVEGILGLHSTPLYTTPPAPVSAPLAIHDEDFEKALSVLNDTLDDCGDSERGLLLALDKAGIEVRSDACRAAMLQGGKS